MIRLLPPAAAILALLAVGGCGASSPPLHGAPLPAAERADLQGLALTLERVDDDLGQGFVAGAATDCDRACLLRGHVCALAERICAIAGRHPGEAEARERCRDARARCRRAHERVAERCRCR